MATDKVVPPGIPAEEFPHAEAYASDEKSKLPEWWMFPDAVKAVHAKVPATAPPAATAPKKP